MITRLTMPLRAYYQFMNPDYAGIGGRGVAVQTDTTTMAVPSVPAEDDEED